MSDETVFLAELNDSAFFEKMYEITKKELEKIQNAIKKSSELGEIKILKDADKIMQHHLQFKFGGQSNEVSLNLLARRISETASYFISLDYALLRNDGVPQDTAIIAAQNEFITDAYLAAKNTNLRDKYSGENLAFLKEPLDKLMSVSQEFKVNFSYKPEEFAAFLIKNLYRSLREIHPECKSLLYTNLETLNRKYPSKV